MGTILKFAASQFMGWRKQEIIWLFLSLAAIISLSLYWRDSPMATFASITGLLYTILAGKGKPICFVFGLINTPIYAKFAFDAGYYGDFALNIYYFAMMFPGLYFWLKNQSADKEEGIKRSKLSLKGRAKLFITCAIATIILWKILCLLGGTRPFCDAATNVLSIAAMALTLRRAIEEWILWITVNAIEIVMWYKAYQQGDGAISILVMWILFLANGIYLFYLWRRIEKKKQEQF